MKKSSLPIFLSLLLAVSPVELAWGEEDKAEACQADVDTCVSLMREQFVGRGTLGLLVLSLAEENEGSEVTWAVAKVLDGSPAYAVGLREGDTILSWNGNELPKVPEATLREVKVGQEVPILVERNGKEQIFAPIAREPSPETVEMWLMGYVHANFSKEEFEDYRARAEKSSAPAVRPETDVDS